MSKIRSYLILPIAVLFALFALMVSPAAAQTGEMYRVTRWTDVYATPGGARLAGAVLAPDTIVELVSTDASGNWAEITSENVDGWVPFDALIESDAMPPGDSAMTNRWTNIWDAPDGEPTGTALPPNTPVEIVGRNAAGNWVEIVTATGTGWIPANAITGGAPGGTTPPPAPPAPMPPADDDEATAPPEDEEFITVFYLSNPNEILGEFPVRTFDAEEFYTNLILLRAGLEVMKNNLDGALRGDAEACETYAGAYLLILLSGVFYVDVPPQWQDADARYFLSFIYALDRTRPAFLSCLNAGRVDSFNYGLAMESIYDAIAVVDPAIQNAEQLLGIVE